MHPDHYNKIRDTFLPVFKAAINMRKHHKLALREQLNPGSPQINTQEEARWALILDHELENLLKAQW